MITVTKEFNDLLNNIDDKIGRDSDDLNMFEWLIDNHYYSIIKKNKEYFKDRPDLLSINKEHVVYELKELIKYFIEKEEYEKCARIKSIVDAYNN